MSVLTFLDVVEDIHAMDEELSRYETRYGLRSLYFYELYQAGRLRDEDALEAREYADWAACYEIKRHREELYDAVVRNALQQMKLQQTMSLADLKLTLRPVEALVGV